MTWDLKAGDTAISIGATALPEVRTFRGMDITNRGLSPRAGSLSCTLVARRLAVGDTLVLEDLAGEVVWRGRARAVPDTVDQRLNVLRVAVEAAGPIAEIVAIRAGFSIPFHTNITVDAAINLILDVVGFSAASRDIGSSPRMLTRWWLDPSETPWSAILTLLRTAGPNARIGEDLQGRVVFRDEPLPAAASRTLRSRITATPENTIISRKEDESDGLDRVVNDVTLDLKLDPWGDTGNREPVGRPAMGRRFKRDE